MCELITYILQTTKNKNLVPKEKRKKKKTKVKKLHKDSYN